MAQDSNVKKLANVGLPSTTGTLYTSPVGKRTMIRSLVLHNSSVSNQKVELWLVTNGGSTTYVTKFLSRTLLPDQTYAPEIPLMLDAQDTIQGKAANASAVSLFINGAEVIDYAG